MWAENNRKLMIWLASFPRSGNTFLRNILFEVYGLPSSTYHRDPGYPLDENFDEFPFIKTHELPGTLDLEGFPAEWPALALVRDGRDTICSIAQHRSNLIAPGSDLFQNMEDAILAERGSFFGGWSENVQEWCKRADLVMRFEDLVREPLQQVERLRALHDLPIPVRENLPTFENQKSGIPEYGARRRQAVSDEEKQHHARLFFRKGQAGAWRDEMPKELQELFWSVHGHAMEALGYTKEGRIQAPHPDLDIALHHKLGLQPRTDESRQYRVLIEAEKLVSADNDGVKRYQVELLKAMFPLVDHPASRWSIDLYFDGHVKPLKELQDVLFRSFSRDDLDEGAVPLVDQSPDGQGQESTSEQQAGVGAIPQPNLALRFERWLTGSVPRGFVGYLQRHDVSFLHNGYEFVRAGAVGSWEFMSGLARQVSSGVSQATTWNSERRELEKQDKRKANHPWDLVHIPLKQNFHSLKNVSIPKLITFHDMTHLHFPQYHTKRNIDNARRGVQFAEQSGADIIAVSHATHDDILAHTTIAAPRVHVIQEAADPQMFSIRRNQGDCRRIRKKYGLDFNGPYIICLSTLEPRKNLENTIKAYLSLLEDQPELDLRLVIAGKKGWDASGIYELASGKQERVCFTGFVEDEDLAYLYSDALCLSYLSFYEGFGLPPLEAMRCGTPVIYGANSSLIEVVGAGGLATDPSNVEEIKQHFLTLYRDEKLRKQLSFAALHQANQFSWRQAAIQTVELYRELIDANA